MYTHFYNLRAVWEEGGQQYVIACYYYTGTLGETFQTLPKGYARRTHEIFHKCRYATVRASSGWSASCLGTGGAFVNSNTPRLQKSSEFGVLCIWRIMVYLGVLWRIQVDTGV